MIFANVNGARVEAMPGARGTCPSCGAEVLAKCGDVNEWHWAHVSLVDCDTWSEGETSWHRWWKELAPAADREVVIGLHRADICHPDGHVIELQHSPLSVSEIKEREAFYTKDGRSLTWLLDGAPFNNRFEVVPGAYPSGEPEEDRGRFRWRYPKRSWAEARCPIFIDLGARGVYDVRCFRDGARWGAGFLLDHRDVFVMLGLRLPSGWSFDQRGRPTHTHEAWLHDPQVSKPRDRTQDAR